MEFIQINAQYYCGIDLHGRRMFITIMDATGNIYFRQNMKNDFKTFLGFIKPYLPDIAVGVESTYNWYWLADGCHDAGIPFYLGHALYMKVISGSKKKSDRLDSKTIANLMRGNLFPPAYAYPREMRATRDLLRRRCYYVSLRAGANTHIQSTFSQEAILDIDGWDVKQKKSRLLLLDRLMDPDQQFTVQCDLELMTALDSIITAMEKRIREQAKHHDRNAVEILQTTPGIGDILALTVLYEIHRIDRFPTVQQFSSYSRVVRCERTSDGKLTGGGHQKIGNPYLKWAFQQIILKAQGQSPLIKRCYERLVAKHGPKKAKSIMGHKYAIAVYYMLKNGQAFDEVRLVTTQSKN